MTLTEEHFRSATRIGGKRFNNLLLELSKHIQFPVGEGAILKYRGVGKLAVEHLGRLGLIFPDVHSQLHSLSSRAQHCLECVGADSKETAKKAIESGILKPGLILHYGWGTHVEVCKWAGLPIPQKPRPVIICPHCNQDIDWPNKPSRYL